MKDIVLNDGERLDAVNQNITLISKKDGLTFGTDAYLLASFIRPSRSAKAAELGSGTGIISLLLASEQRLSHITAIEIQSEFANITKRNVELNGLSDKIDVIEGDIRDISRLYPSGELDVVFTNPPYMRVDSGKRNASDAKFIARHEVAGNIGDFCRAADRLLRHGGRFYCVWRPDRLAELFAAMNENHLSPKVMTLVHADSDSEPSMALILATKYGAPAMRVTAPLLLHDDPPNPNGTRELSKKASRIYDTMSFYE